MADETFKATRKTGGTHQFLVSMPHTCDPVGEWLAEKAPGRAPRDDVVGHAKEETPAWVAEKLSAIQKCPFYKKMPGPQKEAFDRIWKAFARWYADFSTFRAAWALWDLHRRDQLDPPPAGHAFLSKIDGLVARDKSGGANGYFNGNVGYGYGGAVPCPYTSDMILVLGRSESLELTYSSGKLPEERALSGGGLQSECEEVAARTRKELWSDNQPFSGGALYYAEVLKDSFTPRFAPHALQPGERDTTIGTGAVRKRAGTADDPLPVGASPDQRLFSLDKLLTVSTYAVGMGWGNCAECSATTAVRLHERGIARVEILAMRGDASGGDHAFVAVSRDPSSGPDQPPSWGGSALIVESWGKDVVGNVPVQWSGAYPAREGRKRLPGRGTIDWNVRLPDPP